MIWDRTAVAALPLLLPVGALGMFVGQSVWPLAVVGGAELGLLGLARRSDRHAPGDRWQPMSPGTTAARARPSREPVTASLAAVEIRELLLSPWFQTGVAFCLVFLVGITSFERSWWGTAGLMPLLVHPLCGFTIVAVFRNVSRARRDGTSELLDACPVGAERRRAAHLLTSTVPVAVATAFVTISLVGASFALDHIYGPFDARAVTDVVVACLLLPIGATALGVLLGRRFTAQIAPIVALAAIALLNLEFWDETDGRVWLATGLPSPPNDLVYYQPPMLGRLVWLVGLVAVVAAAAVWTARRRTVALATGATVAVSGVLLVALGPNAATAERLAGFVLGDDAVTACTELSATVEVCVPEPYGDHGAYVASTLRPVVDAAPVDRLPPIALWMLVDDVDALQADVRELVPPTPLPPHVVALPFSHQEGDVAAARLLLAAAAVGVPVGPAASENVLVDGQARGVVMLWLATNGLADDDVDRLLTPADTRESASYRGHLWPGMCRADVQWAPQDVVAARDVTALDRGPVAEVLVADWDRWTDPATSTDDLLSALGVPPVGPPEPIEPLGDTCT